MSKWMDIVTAPKNGTVILGYSIEEDDDLTPQIMKWVRGMWVINWDNTPMTGVKYFRLPSGEDCPTGHFHAPTHWMFLPDPPA